MLPPTTPDLDERIRIIETYGNADNILLFDEQPYLSLGAYVEIPIHDISDDTVMNAHWDIYDKLYYVMKIETDDICQK